MPEVMVGWCAHCWAHWGGISGRIFYILEGMIYNTPIWDVLTPEEEQEEAGEHLSTHSRCLAFPIRQVVPVGLPQALDHCWAHWLWFLLNMLYICVMSLLLLYHFISVWGGRNGWMVVNGFG